MQFPKSVYRKVPNVAFFEEITLSFPSLRPRNNPLSSVVLSRNISTTSIKMQEQQWDHTLTINNINPCIKTMEYAVRGPLVIRATEIEKELEQAREILKSQQNFFSVLTTHHVIMVDQLSLKLNQLTLVKIKF